VPKRIILLLDGTWNDSDFGAQDTNIVRIRDMIARSLWAENDAPPATSSPAPAAPRQTIGSSTQSAVGPVTSKTFANVDNIVFYERGVGTGAFLNRFFGGALGEGLDGNIRRAYKFLSFHYVPGDQIFVFGFSRGAFTARSLVGYIHAAGLLKRDDCTPELERNAWEFYRRSPNDRLPGVWSSLTPFMHDRSELRIACLGVFDTVGALGIPFPQFKVFNRDTYEFHDVELCAITDVNLHALAIDEQRPPFEPTLWRRSKFKNFKTAVEQVWFSGAHADIGGGYVDEERRIPDGLHSLDDLTLDWMIKRIRHYFRDFPISDAGWSGLTSELVRKAAISVQHQSRADYYLALPRALRSLNNVAVACRHVPFLKPFSEINVGRDRHEEPTNEMVHVSSLLRWRAEVMVDHRQRPYSPRNLQAVLASIAATYQGSERPLPIVDWDGCPLDPRTNEGKEKAAGYLKDLVFTPPTG
jgi:hypothetical protein